MKEIKTRLSLNGVKVHYGTCDCCGDKKVFVVHLGYDTRYRFCEHCLRIIIDGLNERLKRN